MPSTPVARRRSRGVLAAGAAGAAVALVVALAACTSPAPTVSSAPSADASASSEPIFASDEEALAAAVVAYEAYQEVTRMIAADAGEDAERISSFVTEEYRATALAEFAVFRDQHLRISGAAAVDSATLAEYDPGAVPERISIYVCRDVSGVRVIDASGNDITPADRQDRTPLNIALEVGSADSVLINSVDVWSGTNFC